MGLSDPFSSPRARMLSTWSRLKIHLHPKYNANDHRKDAIWPTLLGLVAIILGGLHKVVSYSLHNNNKRMLSTLWPGLWQHFEASLRYSFTTNPLQEALTTLRMLPSSAERERSDLSGTPLFRPSILRRSSQSRLSRRPLAALQRQRLLYGQMKHIRYLDFDLIMI